MKKTVHSIILLLVFTVVNCQSKSNYVEVSKSELDQEKIEFAKSLSDKILTAQKDGKFYSLSENEATLQMVEGLDESRQKDSHKKIVDDYVALNNTPSEKANYKRILQNRARAM